MALEKRTLGTTEMEVTVLGYGAMELRGAPRGPEISDADAGRVLNAVLDAGINYIDTSPDYGLSEERIGKFIAHRRDEYFLASKCGCLVGATPAPAGQRNPHVFTAENVRSIRPGYGLPPKHLPEILGRRAGRAIARGTPLAWSLIAPDAWR